MSSQTVNHLRAEHQRIEEVLSAFERFLETGLDQEAIDHHELAALVDCLAESVMLKHEEKEETILLPELARRGFSWSDGAVAHVRQDHRHGRYLLRSLRQGARQRRAWSTDDQRHVAIVGREWIEFNRRHMANEEAQLFPFLEGSLSPDEDTDIAHQFAEVDQEYAEMSDAKQLNETRESFISKFAP